MEIDRREMGEIHDREKFRSALNAGDVEYLKTIFSQGANPREIEPGAMILLTMRGRHECLRLVLSAWTGAHQGAVEALFMAANRGHAECAELLIPLCDLLNPNGQGLTLAREARIKGHASVAAMIESSMEAQLLELSIPVLAQEPPAAPGAGSPSVPAGKRRSAL